jgi:hypothetical protein
MPLLDTCAFEFVGLAPDDAECGVEDDEVDENELCD